jgi:type II secretory pathway component HofQ
MELKDAPVRTSLEMIFKQAGIKSYVIENSVSGLISMNLSDQPFENALKLVMRANTIPLTYTKENDVYIVKARRIVIEANPEPTNYSDLIMQRTRNSITWEVIRFNYIDPFDLQSIFGNILFVNQFRRYTGGMNGGVGGFGGGRNF